ncbi:ribosomal protein S18 acetylase RimI-like enzyme [Chryseobacterium ginsenosidimutans]|uniref:GNAT family N-acetyltransferase n=1 Tax=Chryseobacterium ginsenosidimutans TaxID=687846 RepID=UPI002780AEA8|nr:GNAT family N-acetyltransferase [Chryseobacterium ginsenosidimutans]MDQ0593128.1 ribosomal protein S18 acetylase RimI-like enzyme [Chryseobacterium ginsenosidimutans]
MEIRKLEKITENPTHNWGFNGYKTDKIFVVSAIELSNTFEFRIREKNQSYTKDWEKNPADLGDLNKIIEKGHSFGAFQDNELIGWIICDFREWNNSLFIENMLVSETFRRQNIGRLLIKAVNRKAKELQCRIVELETQNTNYGAIQFYQKAGFTITGINTKLYNDSTETALFMSFELMF